MVLQLEYKLRIATVALNVIVNVEAPMSCVILLVRT
jgi:hypothetical protein